MIYDQRSGIVATVATGGAIGGADYIASLVPDGPGSPHMFIGAMILGPLAAFELLAITDYIAQNKMPLLSLAAAEDMTQRRPNPYFIRASATSAARWTRTCGASRKRSTSRSRTATSSSRSTAPRSTPNAPWRCCRRSTRSPSA